MTPLEDTDDMRPHLDRTSAPRRGARPGTGHAPSAPTNGAQRPDYAARVQALRQARGWTQEDLASRLGLSVTTIHRWESGDYRPRGHAWRRFLQAEQGKPVAKLPTGLSAREARLAHIAREVIEALRDHLATVGEQAQTDPVLKRRARLLEMAEGALNRLTRAA